VSPDFSDLHDSMNVDARILFGDGERAARSGEPSTARACFLEAADAAAEVQLWRSALRCYRHALELDLLDREVIERILGMPARVISGRGWDEYRSTLEAQAKWARFGCRGARVVIGDEGAVVECPSAGSVLELIMSDRDLIEVRPHNGYAGMPSAMALVILRRAMWPAPREHGDLMNVRVSFDGRQRVRLDEHGDWEPIVRE
jgi:hypothetical protein